MHLIVGLTVFNVAFVVAGYGLLAALRRPFSIVDLGLAFCAGFALLLVASCLLALAGRVPRRLDFLLLAAAAASPLAARAVRHGRGSSGRWRPSLPRGPARWVRLLAFAGIAGAGLGYAILLLRESSVDVLDEWDAWSYWTLIARKYLLFGDLPKAVLGSAHPDYPPLVPLMQSLFFRFAGGIHTQLLHVEYALLVLAFALAVARLAAERLPFPAGAAFGLYVLLLPGLERNVPDALADVPVAIFASLAAVAMASWLMDGRLSWLGLFVVFGAAAAWTKNEGTMLVACIGFCGTAAALGRRWRRAAVTAAATAVAYLLFYPWHSWLRSHHVAGWVPVYRGLNLHNIAQHRAEAVGAFHTLWSQLGSIDVWGGVPYLSLALLVVALVARRGVRVALFAVAAPALAFGFFVWVYAIADQPLGIAWLLATSSTRVVTSVGLMAAAVLPLQVMALLESSQPPRDRDDVLRRAEPPPAALSTEP